MLIFGIHDDKVGERLLHESQLTLQEVDEIYQVAESTTAQIKEVGHTVSAFMLNKNSWHSETKAVSVGKQNPVETAAEHMEPENASLLAKHATCGKANHFVVVCHLAVPSQRR